MIRSFASRDAERLFFSLPVPRFKNIERTARRKLLLLHLATSLDDLRIAPGNHLEVLPGRRVGQHGIRINSQWRICFRWTGAGADSVEIVDDHQEVYMKTALQEIHPGEILREEFLVPLDLSEAALVAVAEGSRSRTYEGAADAPHRV